MIFSKKFCLKEGKEISIWCIKTTNERRDVCNKSIWLVNSLFTIIEFTSARRLRSFLPRYFGFIFIYEGVSWHPVRNNCNLPILVRFTQPRPACLAGKVVLYTTAVLGNVRTHLSLKKLKSNNKVKNYAIYGTDSIQILTWIQCLKMANAKEVV